MTPDKISLKAERWMDRQLEKTIVRDQAKIFMNNLQQLTQKAWNYYCRRLRKIDGKRRGYCMLISDLDTCEKVTNIVVRAR